MNKKNGTWIALLLSVTLVMSCASGTKQEPDGISGPSPAVKAETSIIESIPAQAVWDRVLVVYFSQGNAAKTVAEDLAKLTGADLEVIVEKKKRTGFLGFMGAGMDASFKAATPIAEPVFKPADYDTVIVCTPVWSWNLCPPVRSWLRLNKGTIPRAAFITVSGDTEPDKIVKSMVKESGVVPFASVGFAERDFYPENRELYVRKIATIVGAPR